MTARHRLTGSRPSQPDITPPYPPPTAPTAPCLCLQRLASTSHRLDCPALAAVPNLPPALEICQIRVITERNQARVGVGRRSMRWGDCVHEHAKKRRTRNAEDRRADRDAALAHRTPEQRGLPASARTQGNVSMCTSSSMPDKSVRMQAASGARLLGSWCAHATSAGRGIVAGLPALKKKPRMMESRPKAPWCEGDRPSRPSPHHGAASSRMELARASS